MVLKNAVQAAKLVLSTAALKSSMKGEKQQTKDEIIREYMGKALGEAAKEMGIRPPGEAKNS
ncbi:MAG: hypothetical protein Q8N39_03015 [Pelolinea sp.]|nr:hypothetical protein [Pelolinea sp.]